MNVKKSVHCIPYVWIMPLVYSLARIKSQIYWKWNSFISFRIWFEIFQPFSTCTTCLLLFLYYLPNHSICMLYLKNSILQTNQFCWNYLHSECLHWGVDFEELLQRGKERRFLCELCRYCWAQLTWCTPAQTLVFSTYKKINREAASHMVPLEEEIMIQVTSYFGFGLTYCIESLKQNCKYFFERVCNEHFFFLIL